MDITMEVLNSLEFKKDGDGLPYIMVNNHHVAIYPETNTVCIVGMNCQLTIRNIVSVEQLKSVVELGTGNKWCTIAMKS